MDANSYRTELIARLRAAGRDERLATGQLYLDAADAIESCDGPEDDDLPAIKAILQGACDRDWEDETLYQTAMIVCNAIYWRNREITELKKKLAALGATNCHSKEG